MFGKKQMKFKKVETETEPEFDVRELAAAMKASPGEWFAMESILAGGYMGEKALQAVLASLGDYLNPQGIQVHRPTGRGMYQVRYVG